MTELINEQILKIRKNHKLSRSGLENISGFKERTIGAYERGEREPSREYLEFMSLYFGYHPDNFKSDSAYVLNPGVHQVLMYQSMYDYTDEQMADRLGISLDDYLTMIRKNSLNRPGSQERTPHFILKIADTLNLSPSELGLERTVYEPSSDGKTWHKNENSEYTTTFDRAEKKAVKITVKDYAKVIKKRNQPKENYTPISTTNELPEKYKEVIELLPFVPDSFIDTLIEKLKAMREAQKL